MSKIFFAFTLFLSTILLANSLPQSLSLESRGIAFEYTTMEGSTGLIPCKHSKTSSPYDLDVECMVGKEVHRYSVHLLLNFYTHQSEQKSSYELLYWVTDYTQSKPVYSSSSTWIHNKTLVPQLDKLEVSQGIEQDQAYLKFTYQSP